ncbi:UNVERIFIED_CONTAM: hypothetical protein K2H54_063603, partial [Gekko kuhli]
MAQVHGDDRLINAEAETGEQSGDTYLKNKIGGAIRPTIHSLPSLSGKEKAASVQLDG